jgi:glutathione S-transferase
MRALLYTPGSSYSRAVRVILHELGLDYEKRVQTGWETVEERARSTPTLQVPMFWDGNIALWDSEVIAEYLLAAYPRLPESRPPLAPALWRPEQEWPDKLVLATVRTLGTSVTTISQLTWTGVRAAENAHLARCADRLPFLLGWLESQLGERGAGFLPGLLSLQDILLACHLRFLQNRPLGVEVRLEEYPKVNHLLDRLDERASFRANPIWWWEPGIAGHLDDGTPVWEEGKGPGGTAR